MFDRDVLEDAGIKDADCFAAVTSGDNSNIVAARTAREYYRVPRVIARIYDPRRAEIYRGLGISTIASVTWTSTRLLDMVTHPDLHSEYQYGNAEVEMMEVELPATLAGKTVADLTVPGEVAVASIVRAGRAILPVEGSDLREGRHPVHQRAPRERRQARAVARAEGVGGGDERTYRWSRQVRQSTSPRSSAAITSVTMVESRPGASELRGGAHARRQGGSRRRLRARACSTRRARRRPISSRR